MFISILNFLTLKIVKKTSSTIYIILYYSSLLSLSAVELSAVKLLTVELLTVELSAVELTVESSAVCNLIKFLACFLYSESFKFS